MKKNKKPFELKEETNLDVSNIEYKGFIEWNNFGDNIRHLAMLYKTNCYKGTPKSSNEGKVFFIKEDDLIVAITSSDKTNFE